MNKIMTKLSGLFLGLAMMVGVGAGISTHKVSEVRATTLEVTRDGTAPLTASFANIGTSPISIKTSSTNSYSNPNRAYANVTITIKATNVNLKYVTYVASSTGNYVTYAKEATVDPSVPPTVSGKNVTWTFNSEITEFTFTPKTQTRWDYIKVGYESSAASDAVPLISGISSSTKAKPGETFNLSYSWSEGTKPQSESPSWTSNSSYATFSNATSSSPVLTISSLLETKETIIISLRINDDEKYEATVEFNAAPHILSDLTISASVKKEFKVDDIFELGDPKITAKYVDDENEELEASDLSYQIDNKSILLGDKMHLSYNNKTVTASYTFDGVTKTAEYNVTVAEKEMPAPISESGWNLMSQNSTFIDNDIVILAGADVGYVGDGNSNNTSYFAFGSYDSGGNKYLPETIYLSDDKNKVTDPSESVEKFTVKVLENGNIHLTANDKYLKAGGTNKNKIYLAETLDVHCEWAYSFDSNNNAHLVCACDCGDDSCINKEIKMYAGNKSDPARFACYSTNQKGIKIYRESAGDTTKAAVQTWINTYLKFQTIATDEKGSGLCTTWYNDAKDNLLLLDKNDSNYTHIHCFTNAENTEFAAAKERYEAWAYANNDAKPYGDSGIEPSIGGLKINFLSNNVQNISSSTWIIAVIAVVGLSAIGGYFFYHKRKEI